jgi:tungstate transport system substrate-binding protein
MSRLKLPLLLSSLLLVLALVLGACAPAAPAAPAKPANPDLILATTTSTQDSGLLDTIIPMFQTKTGYVVKTVAVGSGAAMTMGERGEADVLLVHSPDAEVAFVSNGFGINRKLLMHNDFIIVGPAADPAGIKGMASAVDASSKSIFVTRGDNSGTNALELKLWKAAAIDTKGLSWYQSTGQGMGATLNVTAEKNGYTITDRATQLATVANTKLTILVEGDKNLLNIYHVIEVNPAKWPKVNAAGAKAFSDFMIDPATQKAIGEFGISKYGKPLFFADAGKPEF